MTGLITVVGIWVGAIAALATPVVYAIGNRWWTNYWGRTLMAKDVVIGLAYARSVTTLVQLRAIPPVDWQTVAITLAMALVLMANLAVMIRVTYRTRGGTPAVEVPDRKPASEEPVT